VFDDLKNQNKFELIQIRVMGSLRSAGGWRKNILCFHLKKAFIQRLMIWL